MELPPFLKGPKQWGEKIDLHGSISRQVVPLVYHSRHRKVNRAEQSAGERNDNYFRYFEYFKMKKGPKDRVLRGERERSPLQAVTRLKS